MGRFKFKHSPKLKRTFLSENASLAKQVLWGAVILLAIIGLLFFGYRVNRQLKPAEYEGRILDKWAGYSHTDEGSFPYFRILLETDEGGQLTVAVDNKTYDRAKIGMRIKKSSKGIELSLLKVFSSAKVT